MRQGLARKRHYGRALGLYFFMLTHKLPSEKEEPRVRPPEACDAHISFEEAMENGYILENT